jgi:two-component sensor histidine kinase
MKKKKTTGLFVRNGILVGFLFPIFSVLFCVFYLVPEDYSFSFKNIHKDFPLLWVIDLAPIVLGAISYIVGTRAQKLSSSYLNEIEKINNEVTETNAQLKTLLEEKEILLKEIHHRVKNNLQVITSLLSLQSSFIEEDETKALFRYSQYRINSMALIHEMLYKSQDISKINYGIYAENLVSSLIISMKGSDHSVKLKLNIPKISINIDTAIPLGLLINEIITNALKYGIRDDNPGEIHLNIVKTKHNHFKMEIGDNGNGFSKGINFRNSNSLGLLLIHKLSLQLNGKIEKDNDTKGTNYIVFFEEIQQIS